MSNTKIDRDLSYFAGWACGIYLLGFIGALDFYLRGARRKAFQALLCALVGLVANILVVALLGQRSGSEGSFMLIGTWFFLTPLTLYYLRTLDWPVCPRRSKGDSGCP